MELGLLGINKMKIKNRDNLIKTVNLMPNHLNLTNHKILKIVNQILNNKILMMILDHKVRN